jgi:hypothetical protein
MRVYDTNSQFSFGERELRTEDVTAGHCHEHIRLCKMRIKPIMLDSPMKSGIFEAQSLEKSANPGHWLHLANHYMSAGWNN